MLGGLEINVVCFFLSFFVAVVVFLRPVWLPDKLSNARALLGEWRPSWRVDGAFPNERGWKREERPSEADLFGCVLTWKLVSNLVETLSMTSSRSVVAAAAAAAAQRTCQSSRECPALVRVKVSVRSPARGRHARGLWVT